MDFCSTFLFSLENFSDQLAKRELLFAKMFARRIVFIAKCFKGFNLFVLSVSGFQIGKTLKYLQVKKKMKGAEILGQWVQMTWKYLTIFGQQ